MNRYEVFITVTECGSFSRAAERLNYTQSAVSQMVHTLEDELSATLLLRSKAGVTLTPAGEEYLPYIRAICSARRELLAKKEEMQGLKGGNIRIGTFTSVSRNVLPRVIKAFKALYPSVQFELLQGEYTGISNWIAEGRVDFGFVNADLAGNLTVIPLAEDEMRAVLPPNHPLAKKQTVSLTDLAKEPYILLGEGDESVPLRAFQSENILPNTQYEVLDDYTIMSMVEQGLGVSLLYRLVLQNVRSGIVSRPLSAPVKRTIALAYKNKKALSAAAQRFIDFILNCQKEQNLFDVPEK